MDAGYGRLRRWERLRVLTDWAGLQPRELGLLTTPSALPHDVSEGCIENSIGNFPLPLGIATGFVVDGQAVAVPMAVDQRGVIATTSAGAELVAQGGGFRTEVHDPVSIGQVELQGVQNPQAARTQVMRRAKNWVEELNDSIPNMVARGGGVRAIRARNVGEWRLVLHLEVDTRNAMGANTVNGLCQRLAPLAAKATGATAGARVVSNLADQRLVAARCDIPAAALGGRSVIEAMVAAYEFAQEDPYRAATCNKEVMDGIDAALVATGNDWRAVEAAAHAHAARDGRYGALAKYRRAPGDVLAASLVIPMPVGTVGGLMGLHPSVPVVRKILGSPNAKQLAGIVACAGLANSLGRMVAPH